jgi:hypothetical protein
MDHDRGERPNARSVIQRKARIIHWSPSVIGTLCLPHLVIRTGLE